MMLFNCNLSLRFLNSHHSSSIDHISHAEAVATENVKMKVTLNSFENFFQQQRIFETSDRNKTV